MVRSEYEQGVPEPGLGGGLAEEELQGVVRIADSPIDGEISFNRISVLITLRDVIWMMGGGGEGGCGEGLGEGSYHVTHILEELLVPDGPVTVKHGVPPVLGFLHEILPPEIVIITYDT